MISDQLEGRGLVKLTPFERGVILGEKLRDEKKKILLANSERISVSCFSSELSFHIGSSSNTSTMQNSHVKILPAHAV